MWNREERPGQYASSRHFCRGFPAHPDDDARPLTGNAGNLGDGRGRRTRYPIGGMALIWLCLPPLSPNTGARYQRVFDRMRIEARC
jgi:hypothetical protein